MKTISNQIEELKEDIQFRRNCLSLPDCTEDEINESWAKLMADRDEIKRLRKLKKAAHTDRRFDRIRYTGGF